MNGDAAELFSFFDSVSGVMDTILAVLRLVSSISERAATFFSLLLKVYSRWSCTILANIPEFPTLLLSPATP